MSATVSFRQNRAKVDGVTTDKPCSILVYYYNKGVEVELSTGHSVPPANFTGSRVQGVPLAKKINKLLSDIENELLNIQFDYQNISKTYEEALARAIIKRQPVESVQKKTVETWITDFIARAKVAPATKREYNTAFSHLKMYSGSHPYGKTWESFTMEFYHSFMEYLWDVCKMNDNTVGKTVKQVKKFISAAFDEDQHTNLTFQKRSFRVISAEVDETYLSELEIEKFDKADISSRPELLESKKRFVFDCWVGLRNSDLTRLGPNNLVRMLWGPALKVTTQKTGEDVVIPFHPTAKAIWDSWGGIPPKKTQKYSQDIKDIAELAGMKEKIQRRNTLKGQVIIEWLPKFKMITPHTGRRSFATNCYLMGQPTKTIMAVTGHKSEKEFMKYIRLSKEQHASIMNGFFNPKEENNLMKKEA